MKKTVFFAALLALSAFAETNSIDWRYGKPGIRVVTNAPSVSLFTAEVARVDARIDGIGFADNSHKMNITDGTSTNQTLYSPIVTNKLGFGTAFADALVAGEVAWDPDWMTFRAGVGAGVTGQFFQESHIYAKNVSGQTVTNGMAVRFSGVVGNSGKCEFVLAKAEVGVRPATTLGIATHDIANGALGKITWFGNVNAIDTTGALYGETGWTNNMIVYLSTNTPGFLTKYEPQAPQPRISLGAVINSHAQNGTLLVRPTWGMKITDADDVNGTALTASGQIMVWDQARGVFDFTENINGYVTTETFSTNRVTRWYDPELSTRWAEWDGGTNIVIYKAEVSGTNLQVTLSSDFEETATHTRPSWTTTNWPFTDGDWVAETYPDGFVAIKAYLVEYSSWGGNVNTLPAVLTPDSFAQGTATVSIASFNYTTNTEWRYYLPTNAIPPELANLDNLQGWLNNLYAMKSVVDGHITDGAHTNVTLAGTVTIGGVTRTDWPAGGGATNITDGVTQGTYTEATRTFDISAITGKAITNGSNYAKIGGAIITNDYFLMGVSAPQSTSGFGGPQDNHFIIRPPSGVNSGIMIASDTPFIQYADRNFNAFGDFGFFDGDIYFVNRGTGKIRFGHKGKENELLISNDGNVEIINSLTVTGTNTASVVRSTGGYIIGPTISGKQAHIITDGTNCFFVNVNSVTNAAGGGETSIIAPLYESGTNVTVTSTQSVYSVAMTGAGPVGIDWSGLALDGTGRAEVTLRLNVTEWGGTNVSFASSMTFDTTPEILVTGVWEFACSTIDGMTTMVRQTWPEVWEWDRYVPGTYSGGSGAFGSGGPYPQAINYSADQDAGIFLMADTGKLRLMRVWLFQNSVSTGIVFDCDSYYKWDNASKVTKSVSLANNVPKRYTFAAYSSIDYSSPPFGWDMCFVAYLKCAGTTVSGWTPEIRYGNANERAAYEAGWRP